MKESRRRLALFAGLLVLPVLCVAMPVLAVAQGRVIGKVTDGKGNPIEGVKVIITTPALTKFRFELTSDKEGNWATILNDATLKYTYEFVKQGYIGVKRPDVKVPVGSSGEPVDVQLLTQDEAVAKGVVKTVVDPFTEAYNEAVDKFRSGDLDGAMTKAHEAITLGPQKAIAWTMGAMVASKRKDFDHVVEMGEKALSLDPEITDLYGPLMEAYRAKGDKAKAAEYEKKFVAANPDKPEILYNRAVDFYNKGDAKSAEPILKKVLEANPDYANAHFLLGMCSLNLNKVGEMKTHLKEYLRLEPKGKEAGTAKEMLDAFK